MRRKHLGFLQDHAVIWLVLGQNKGQWLDRKEFLFFDSFQREALSRWCRVKRDNGQACPTWICLLTWGLKPYSGHLAAHLRPSGIEKAYSYYTLKSRLTAYFGTIAVWNLRLAISCIISECESHTCLRSFCMTLSQLKPVWLVSAIPPSLLKQLAVCSQSSQKILSILSC